MSRWLASIGSLLVEYALGLKIRLKLSILVGVSIAVVTVTISTIALDIQERELRLQTEVLGTNLVQSLSAVAEDNLLLSSTAVLQDYIKNFSKRDIPGMEELYVVDRNGLIVAHWIPDSIGRGISRLEWDLLASADSAITIESPTHFRFVESVYIVKRDEDEAKRIFLGGASVIFSKAVLLAPIEETREKIILTSFVVSLIVITAVYMLSKRIVHVIIVLADAARRVGSGDLTVSVVTKIKDEIGTLAREFNLMVLQIREKTQMEKYVSKATKQMLSEQKEATLGGTRRVITAMFTDVRNFTRVTEEQWPEEVVETLNHYLSVQTHIIDEHNGVVDKFLGDGIMAIFVGPHMAENAVKAAISIQKEIRRLNEGRKKRDEIVLTVGVGIATGRAVVGSIGSADRMDHTAIGDTINLSSRLCGTAESYEIYVNEDCASRLGKSMKTQSGGKISVKGKQVPVSIYKVVY